MYTYCASQYHRRSVRRVASKLKLYTDSYSKQLIFTKCFIRNEIHIEVVTVFRMVVDYWSVNEVGRVTVNDIT